ncbi:hypothetical protein MMC08_003036 [Hypocenomyce scalaris]|nr:hypothetical protein [Hypocenomyce scalaris]
MNFALNFLSVASSAHTISPVLLARARSIASEHSELSERLTWNYDSDIAKRVGDLSNAVMALQGWETANDSLTGLRQLLSDFSTDPELRSLAADDLQATIEDLARLSTSLKRSLIPAHPFAHLPCLIEIRPGVGGSEAGLFAGDVVRMYQGFCKRHNLRISLLKYEEAEGVGSGTETQLQDAVLEIENEGAYGILRGEAGVHRVQRIPATENKGRTHTSAISVLVLPSFPSNESQELGEESFNDPSGDYYVDPTDVRTDTMRARGAGGQHVNTTDSAVRLTHIPTNTVVAIQDSRSQPKNREKAWRILRAKLAQLRREAREEEMARLRASDARIARSGRGDKIRTYNWGQQRVTDHRSGITLHDLDGVLEGGDSLDKLMDSVRVWLTERDVESLIADEEAAAVKAAKAGRLQNANGLK